MVALIFRNITDEHFEVIGKVVNPFVGHLRDANGQLIPPPKLDTTLRHTVGAWFRSGDRKKCVMTLRVRSVIRAHSGYLDYMLASMPAGTRLPRIGTELDMGTDVSWPFGVALARLIESHPEIPLDIFLLGIVMLVVGGTAVREMEN
jgi:hypothetical protein